MKKILIIVTLIFIIIISAYGYITQSNELNMGQYITEDGSSWVILDDKEEFVFNLNFLSSYLPYGTYQTDGNKLTLTVNENERYIFTIKKDKIVFNGETLVDAIVEPNTIFFYNPDWKKH